MSVDKFIENNAITIFLSLALILLFLIVIIPTYKPLTFNTLIVWAIAFAFSMGTALYLTTKEYGEEEKKKLDEQKKRGEHEN